MQINKIKNIGLFSALAAGTLLFGASCTKNYADVNTNKNAIATVTPAVIVTFVWQNIGITMVLLLLGLAAIPKDPIEAARVDGATPGQIFRHIVWPLLLPTVLVVTILNVAAGFTTFDLLWVMASDYPGKRTLSLAVYMYYESFSNGGWAYGSAIAVVLGIMVIVVSALLAWLQARVEKRIR